MKPPSDPRLAELGAAVNDRIGLDPQLVGDNSLVRAVCQYMKDEHRDDGDACVVDLLRRADAFAAFAERLLIPETWFFRDREPFRCLQAYALRKWQPRGSGDRLRVLSLPCSTGEEPYSAALALFDAGWSLSQFHVAGADLSRRSLERARAGIYRQASFRGDEAEFSEVCDRYFERRGETFAATPELRNAVTFVQANLVAPDLLAGHGSYDFIYCRNVLIYMQPTARRLVLQNLRRLLAPTGLLYTGHVEARLVREGEFVPVGREYPFAFAPGEPAGRPVASPPVNRVAARPRAAAARRDSGAPPTPAGRRAGPRKAVVAPHAQETPVGTSAPAVVAPTPGPIPADVVSAQLATARLAADLGRFDEAEQICRALLERDAANAEAAYTLGIVKSATGRAVEAEAYFRQALYLQPRHQGALTHMMLLAQQRGDASAAENFQRRAQRAGNGKGDHDDRQP
ncbi:MAG: methyltransferase domain-containing protein [Planctomycetaceae bacterium]|nr:methyltransferase domain-containing protein [Planctomycetaceae bacterium]